MDNQKKFAEALLKADGIDPNGTTESERMAFSTMLDKQLKPKPSKPTLLPDRWRIIMRSNITKLAAAAVIIIAVLTGIYQITGSIDGASVALADVAKRVEQASNCVLKKTTTLYSEDGKTKTVDSLVYFMEGDIREDVYNDEEIINQVYVEFSKETLIGIDHTIKAFKEISLTNEDIENRSMVGAMNFITFILSKGDYKKLGRKKIDGVLTQGFEFNDKRAMLSMDKDKIENASTRIWVDIDTHLPVRVEFDAVFFNKSKAHAVYYDPKWNVELGPDFFESKIPADYFNLKQQGLIGIDLENWPTLKVVPDMAAEKAGIKDGDIALEIDGKSIEHIKSSDDALKCLFGKAGEKVVLTVRRGEQVITHKIEREPSPK